MEVISSIGIICTGNICRSPLAEKLLQRALPLQKIFSAGIEAVEGCPIHPLIEKIAKSFGVDLSNHLSQQLTFKMCKESDLLLCMEKRELLHLHKRYPEFSGKGILYGKWKGEREIPDPMGENIEFFRSVAFSIEELSHLWVDYILRGWR